MSGALRTNPIAEEWREDGDGQYMALHFPGHIDPENAVALAWAWTLDYGLDGIVFERGGPRHTYLRKVPWRFEEDGGWNGSFQYVLSRKGPGATPVTYTPFASHWRHMCSAWPACFEDKRTFGIPTPGSGWDMADYAYWCKRHMPERLW